MDPSIAKKTQDTLGKVIKKPPLTEKLLSKPPFRFLHDIITEVHSITFAKVYFINAEDIFMILFGFCKHLGGEEYWFSQRLVHLR